MRIGAEETHMGRIIFLNPFLKTLITGGIKVCYSHAELLAELGFDVTVFQPDGPPDWLPPRNQALSAKQFDATAADVLVFPECLNGWLGEFARRPTPARKVIFCQNQYYMFTYDITAADYAKYGITKVIVPGRVTKRAVESVLKLPDVSIVPGFIDPELFFPREKVMQIATVPRKFPPLPGGIPGQASLIRAMLALKYPHLRSVPWQMLEGKSQQEVAGILGQSTIVLALSYMEACPLLPLEAMSSGCIVVGYTGYGGLGIPKRL
jgi:glycosyltransferase involved in cell wall biosynthesis